MTLLKNNGNGLYITDDLSSKIVNNTPGDLNLSGLTQGTDYVYLEDVEVIATKYTCNSEGTEWQGFHTASFSQGTTSVTCGGAVKGSIQITGKATEAERDYLIQLFKQHTRLGQWHSTNQKYLVYQQSSDDFKHFYTAGAVQKNYAPVIIRQVQAASKANINDQEIIIMAQEVWSS